MFFINNIIEKENIKDLIYEIREKYVMLDSDLGRLYKCANGTKTINQSVKRNIERFPNDFYFQLTDEEFLNLKSQFGTSSWNDYGGVRKLPYAFTEHGVVMLSSVLRTEVAAKVSIDIMRAFVTMKKYISFNLLEQKYINELVLENHSEIKEIKSDVKLLHESFDKLESKKKINEIYFNGQIFDAYFKMNEIFNEATSELVIVDAYADIAILT